MYKDLKYALDFMFLFMLVVSITLFLISFSVELNGTILETLQKIDFVILGGYYAFFANGIIKAKKKISYIKHHWVMLALLLLPLIPIARLARFAQLERTFAISTNTLWHFLDELGLL